MTPLGFEKPHALVQLYSRNATEFTSDETRLVVEQTAGGPQQVRVFSLRGARLLALLARTKPAARFRRWLLDYLEGRAPAPRAAGDALQYIPDARAVLGMPAVREAISILDTMSAADAEHQRAQARERTRATRLASHAGLSLAELRKLRTLERVLASIPALRTQRALPFADV